MIEGSLELVAWIWCSCQPPQTCWNNLLSAATAI